MLARKLGYLYLDTGAMYRAVALAFRRQGLAPSAPEAAALLASLHLDVAQSGDTMRTFLDGEDVSDLIRTPDISQMASRVSARADVREKLVAAQRRIAREIVARGGGVVVEGRDIGTVVFPDAPVKVFLVASAPERARRRKAELDRLGASQSFETVLAEIHQRDRQDSERALAPLRKAEDAVEVDTTSLGPDEQVDAIFKLVMERKQKPAV